jgi:hypothetical protein
MARAEGPDCICVGLSRAGTGWLYRQLADHPQFWMPPIKELDYLDHAEPNLSAAKKRLARLESRQWQQRDPRDGEFVRALAALAHQPRDIPRYMTLFRLKGEQLSGDITPNYARLEDGVIAEIASLMPQLKVILLVRDPVERAWSRFTLHHRNARVDAGLPNNPDALRDFFRESVKYGDAARTTQVMTRWARIAPQIAFRHFFYDDLIERPEWLRAEILTWLGADPGEGVGRRPVGFNPKADKGPKLAMSDAACAVLVDHYREELIACAGQFGDYGKSWAARYGL